MPKRKAGGKKPTPAEVASDAQAAAPTDTSPGRRVEGGLIERTFASFDVPNGPAKKSAVRALELFSWYIARNLDARLGGMQSADIDWPLNDRISMRKAVEAFGHFAAGRPHEALELIESFFRFAFSMRLLVQGDGPAKKRGAPRKAGKPPLPKEVLREIGRLFEISGIDVRLAEKYKVASRSEWTPKLRSGLLALVDDLRRSGARDHNGDRIRNDTRAVGFIRHTIAREFRKDRNTKKAPATKTMLNQLTLARKESREGK